MILVAALVLHAAAPAWPGVAPVNQAMLNRMSDTCQTPRKWLQLSGRDQVHFRPSPHAKFERVDCLITQLRASKAPMRLGFIGNEQVREAK